MAHVSTYLNFPGNTEQAFEFYRSVFAGEFTGGIQRFKDVPAPADAPNMTDADLNLIMHIELPILGGHILMGTDATPSMGFTLNFGNNVYINLEPDTRGETDRLFAALSAGGNVGMTLSEQFWGGYFGMCTDKFGTQWMFNCGSKS